MKLILTLGHLNLINSEQEHQQEMMRLSIYTDLFTPSISIIFTVLIRR